MKAAGQQSPADDASTEYRDLLRLTQLALLRGKISPQDAPGITKQIVAAYPTNDTFANRELVKLLAYLQPPEAAARPVPTAGQQYRQSRETADRRLRTADQDRMANR